MKKTTNKKRKPAKKASTRKAKRKTATKKTGAATSKRDRLDAMLQRPEGATIGQLTKAFGIKPHSARALISVARKRLGKEIAKDEDGRYRVAGSQRRVPTPM